MKEKFKKIQFLVYAIVMFVLAAALESYLSGLKSYDIDANRITKALHYKECQTDSIIARVQNIIERGDNILHSNSIYVLKESIGDISNSNISIFVYQNDTLRYWSDNKTPVNKLYSKSDINNRILKLSNGWYEIRTVTKNKTIYVGMILLKSEYEVENKYLSHGFMPEFKLSPAFKISTITLSYGFDIQDKEGKYIFTIVPLNGVDHDLVDYTLVGLMFLTSLILLLIFLLNYIKQLIANKSNPLIILSVIIVTLLLRFVSMICKLPSNVYLLDFFDPVYFNGGFFFTTFGDLFINAIFMLFATITIFQLADYIKLKENIATWTEFTRGCFFFAVALVGIFLVIKLYAILQSLIADSTISFQLTNVFQFDVFSISGIAIFALCFASLILSIINITSYIVINNKQELIKVLIITTSVGALVAILSACLQNKFLCATMFYVTALVITSTLMHYLKVNASIYPYIIMILLTAALSSVVITHTTEQKYQHLSEEQVLQAADEHDKIAEQLLQNLSNELSSDALLHGYLAEDVKNGSRVYQYLQAWHFNGFWNKYTLSVKVYEATAGISFVDMQNENAEAIARYGVEIPGTVFYFVDNPEGGISYIGQLRALVNQTPYYICVRLDNKPIPQELGYPELLMSDKTASSLLEGCNYAKYRNGHKTKQNGSFIYDLSDNIFAEQLKIANDTIAVFEYQDYVHTVYKTKTDIIVISRQSVSYVDYIVSFAYLFVAYTLLTLIYMLIIIIIKHKIGDYRSQLKVRLVTSVCLILVLAFVIICIGMAYFNTSKFRNDNTAEINDKMKSVYMHIEQTFGDSTKFVFCANPLQNNVLNEYLSKTAHVFFTDINIYGANGQLAGSSRPEVFKLGLLSTQINATALKGLVSETKANYIQEETIGKMNYTSAYIPFFNSQDKLMGYINLPYFSKPDVMQRELSTIIVSLTNLFVVLMLVSIIIAVFVSERMVHPIRMIQKMMEKVELGKKHKKIEYTRKDEIGQLVSEYNNMVEKLEESAVLLARSERESAWREMAKQIAHEIKNPLTPMKLSIQFLMRSHKNNDSDFDEKLEKVSNTLIQQIDTLSSIATGFSNFAKMPKPNESKFNVVDTLANVVQLFANTENVKITSNFGGFSDITIVADKEQISRVFVNLIKNAIQAIPDGIKGRIHVLLLCNDSTVTVKIKDNGCGIPEEIKGKLFTPSFTTKSSGSGLGLAMCKNIIINAKGEITFESEVNKGTTFIVTLPIVKGSSKN